MMGIDDIVLGFGISYLAGNVPQIKDLIEKSKGVKEQMDVCYDKALKQWSVNSDVREYEQIHKCKHLEELQQALMGRNVESSYYAELIRLWLDEMRKNGTCYNFILEHKIDQHSCQLDAGFSALASLVNQSTEKTAQKLDDVTNKMDVMLAEIQELKSNMTANASQKTIEKLMELLAGSVNELVNKLFVKSARRLIEQIEGLFADEIKKDDALAAQISLLKGTVYSFDEKGESYKSYHKAYLLNSHDVKFIEKEVAVLLNQGDNDGAITLANTLPDESMLKQAMQVAFADFPKQAYLKLDDNKKRNYALRYIIFSLLFGKNTDVAFLFDDEKIEFEETLNYRNLLSWIYVITYYNIKTGNYIILSPNYQAPSLFYDASHAASKFDELLSKTEIAEFYPMLKAQCCYWGYVIDRHPSRIDLIQEVDSNLLGGEQKQMLVIMQASMYAIAGEYDKAISLLAAYNGGFSNDLVGIVLLISYHSKNVKYLEWLLEMMKGNGLKMDSLLAKNLAVNINGDTARAVGNMLTDSLFLNVGDAVVLIQLCNYYCGGYVDVDALKSASPSVSDELLPYAALVLANKAEEKLALDLLKPKVDLHKDDMMQRIYIDVLSKIPEESPNLYHILVDKRKSGAPCDDTMLFNEFTLDVKVSDFKNAFESISLLYERHPEDETVFVNYLWLVGRHHSEELEKLKDKVQRYEFSNPRNVINVYVDYADNDYIEFAAEFLYAHTRMSDDWLLKDTFMKEGVMGKLHSIVQQRYEKVEEDHFVLCSLPDESRKIYLAKTGNAVGELLLGKKENNEVECEIAGEQTKLTIIHIMNKYGKLSYDITKEIMDGDNPNVRPFKIDVAKPLESLESCMEKLSPSSSNYYEDKLEEQRRYEEGKLGLVNMVNPNEILEDYYGKLLSASKTYVIPWHQCQQLYLRGRNMAETRYVLDMTAVIMLFEFQLLSGCSYSGKFIVSTSLYEYLVTCSKNTIRLTSSSIFEAFKNSSMKRYDKYIDLDLQQRIPALVKWIKDSCEIVVPDQTLAMTERNTSNDLSRIITDTLSLVVGENKVLISDDRVFAPMMKYMLPLITTETYIKVLADKETYDRYKEFLMDCNYMGIEIKAERIVSEYIKMESGGNNRFTYIVQNAAYNPYLTTEEVRGCVEIAGIAKNKQQADIMITNMMVSMIKSYDGEVKNSIVSKTLAYLSFNYPNFARVKQCLLDAAKICNVIILPPTFLTMN